jgi:cytoskeletal protein CcmA (bactofilin family)
VYVWQEPAGGWQDAPPTADLTFRGGQNEGFATQFGSSVAIDGDTIVAGAPAPNAEAAAVFQRPAGGWQDATPAALLHVQVTPPDDPHFGQSVAIHGGTIVAGAVQAGVPLDTGYPGAVFLYQEPSGGWQSTTTPDAQLTADDTTNPESQLGMSVAFDGNTIAASAYGWPLLPPYDSPHGAVFVWRQPAAGWAAAGLADAALESPDSPVGDNSFGNSLAISGDQLVVGDPPGGPGGDGAVYLYGGLQSGGPDNTNVQELANPDPAYAEQFGVQVAFSDDRIVASGPSTSELSQSSVYVLGTSQPQVISFPASPVVYGQSDFNPATTSSGLLVNYSDAQGQCAIDGGGLVAVTGVGMCTVTASQPGNQDYSAAAPVTQTFAITPATLFINANDASAIYGQAPTTGYALSGFVNDENATTAAVVGTADCEALPLSSDSGTYPGAIVCTTGSLSAPNYTFTSGSSGTETIAQASQSISFTSTPPASPAYNGSYTVTASGGNSGNPVTFSIDITSAAGSCSIGGSKVTFTGVGVCVIDANQAGDNDYMPAAQAQQKLTIAASSLANGGQCSNLAVTGTIHGNVTVPAGASCLLTTGAHVTGNVSSAGTVTVAGKIDGNLTSSGPVTIGSGSTIGGNLQTQQTSLAITGPGTTIGGNLQVQGGGAVSIIGNPSADATFGITIAGTLQVQELAASNGVDGICATKIGGNVQWQNNAAPVTIGGPNCPGNTIGGNLQVQNNVLPSGNSTPAATIEQNTIKGNLQSQGNKPAAVVSNNSVSGKTTLS